MHMLFCITTHSLTQSLTPPTHTPVTGIHLKNGTARVVEDNPRNRDSGADAPSVRFRSHDIWYDQGSKIALCLGYATAM